MEDQYGHLGPAAGSPWTAFYGMNAPASNLTRITVDGSTAGDERLKITVDKHDPAVLTIRQVLFS